MISWRYYFEGIFFAARHFARRRAGQGTVEAIAEATAKI
jgi:hypothetical protein